MFIIWDVEKLKTVCKDGRKLCVLYKKKRKEKMFKLAGGHKLRIKT